MNVLEKLDSLLPLMGGRIVTLKKDLSFLNGQECFSGSLKGISAYGAVRRTLIEAGLSDVPFEALRSVTLVDASSGNFGRALAFIAEFLGTKAEIFVSSKATGATKDLIRLHGANIQVIGDTTNECYMAAKEYTRTHSTDTILVGQLDNWGNPAGHREITGPAILSALPEVENIFLSMGSGGGVCGIAEYFFEVLKRPVNIFVSVAKPGEKLVGTFSQGIDYETPFIKEVRANRWLAAEIPVSRPEAIAAAVSMRKEYGILPGLSTGGMKVAYDTMCKNGLTGSSIILGWDGQDRWIEAL